MALRVVFAGTPEFAVPALRIAAPLFAGALFAIEDDEAPPPAAGSTP